ncbi:uncharacterized protein LOC105358392 isoform X2 [Oryzias latipes]
MMKACNKFSQLLLWFIFITLLPVFWAQKVEVLSQVTGYVGFDVTLPCRFIQGKESSNVTQSQWDFLSPDGNKTKIMVFNKQHGKDAGSYICTINTFPLGSFHDTTQLHVQEHKPMSAGTVFAIVSVSVLLLLMALSGSAYCILSRRHNHLARVQVQVDSFSETAAPTRPSFIRNQDLVYSDVKFKGIQFAAPSSDDKHRVSTQADDVIYSEVTVLRPISFHV